MKEVCLVMLMLGGTLAWAQSDSHWFQGKTDKADVVAVSSTAELVETQFGGDYLYPPANVLDGKGETTWCPGGRGIDQALTIGLSQAVSFDEIQLMNGFSGPNDLYLKNNRVKRVQVTQVAGEHFQNKTYDLDDQKPGWQSIKFPLVQTAQTLTFTIKDVYRGYKYDDTCLSDIRLLYQGKVIPWTGADRLIAFQTSQSKKMLGANSAQEFRDNYQGFLLVNSDGHGFFCDGQYMESVEKDTSRESFYWISDGPSYTISQNRILVTHVISYVKTVQSMLFVPDGDRGLTINGVYYQRIDRSTVQVESGL